MADFNHLAQGLAELNNTTYTVGTDGSVNLYPAYEAEHEIMSYFLGCVATEVQPALDGNTTRYDRTVTLHKAVSYGEETPV